MRSLRVTLAAVALLWAPLSYAGPVDDTASQLRALLDDRDQLALKAAQADAVPALQAQIAERDARIETLVQQINTLTPPPEPNLALTLSIADITVGPGQTVAQVPFTLSEPTNHTVSLRWQAQNGTNTNQGTHYKPSSGWLIFHPGEQKKLAEVPLLKDLVAGQTIKMVLASTPNNPPLKQSKGSGLINGGGSTALPPNTADAINLPAKPNKTTLSWSVDFADPAFCVTDTGKKADGSPCWQGRPTHGYTQDANKEIGLYASPDRFPNVTMTGLGADGKRFIQFERHPEGFTENGVQIKRAWDNLPFVYSSAMIQGVNFPTVIKVGSYVEARLKMDLVEGTWPAFWLLPSNRTWPPEIDVFEGFWRKNYVSATTLTMSLHWRKTSGNGTYGTDVPLDQFVPGFDVREYHNYGVYIENDWLTYYVDNVPVWRAPNSATRNMTWFPLFDVTAGGLVGEPPADAPLPAKMAIDWLKVWN